MNETFTSDVIITEKNLEQALKSEKLPKPSLNSLGFIKSFARNFRIYCDIEGKAGELMLN